jgi:hypothetical protein
MFRIFMITVIAGMLSVPCAAPGQDQAIVTTGSLFQEMADLAGLARFPKPVYRMVQFSSYDRRSSLPGGPGWFANSDGFGREPLPNFEEVLVSPDTSGVGEYLMVDIRGPGAIVRLWTAAISGRVRLYIDDAGNPLYEGEADAFFRRPYDAFSQVESINRERFGRTVYQRDASYAPIPFSRRMRLVWIGNIQEIHFYQIGVRLYEEKTRVNSFSPDDIHVYRETIDGITGILSDPDSMLKGSNAGKAMPFHAALEPGERKEVLMLEGPGALEQLALRLRANDIDRALRQTLLHILCDDYPWGQVQCPVGDFFGVAPGVNPYISLPFTVRPDSVMVCRYVMPYEKNIRIVLENRGSQSVHVEGDALPGEWSWDRRSMHFRARWRVDHNLIASNREVQDLPFLLAQGRGVYVGTVSYLLNPNEVPTPYGSWWGEGDEKVFVDENPAPALFGTGSEDYYNYSWSVPDIFYFPYCGQPRNDGPGNRGFVTNFRWHILDPVPFTKNIRFYMELYSHERTPGLSYARIGYHYARPGITDDHQPLMPEDLRHLTLPEKWEPASRMGARNSIFFSAEEILENKKSHRLIQGNLWEKGELCLWMPDKEGDRLEFTLPVDSAGKKRLHMVAALAPWSGKVALHLDGKKLEAGRMKEPVDLYRPHRTLLRNFTLMTGLLSRGRHTLTLEFLGAPAGVARPAVGVDFFWIQDM